MQTRRLGNSDLEITPIGIGAWAMGGGDWAFSWGKQEDDESIAAIHTALDAGVNWIDTAAVYGLGHSEEVVGKAIAGLAQRPYVFTKCSLVWNDQGEIGHSLKAGSVRREVEASLRRLRLDVIDLYQIHWPDPEPEIEEGWQTVAQLQKGGQGSIPRRVKLQRRADETGRQDRADHLPAAQLQHRDPRHREATVAVLP
jgi:aryl-alcohol dehydrogenase-like predicted oxidoreductase